jgi:hypothetical protein
MELIYIPQGELQRRIFAISPILRQNSVSLASNWLWNPTLWVG